MKRVFGLIGFPLTHSFSKGYFNEKFSREGLEAVYENFPLKNIEEFPALIESHPALAGLNVTIPYKQSVIPYLDELGEEAAAMGAVNVIVPVKKEGKIRLIGRNSDYLGFRDSIRPEIDRLRASSDHEAKALILGTGGASKAVYYALQQLDIKAYFVSRDTAKAGYTYAMLNAKLIEEFKIIVNTTPLGMAPDTESFPDLPYKAIGQGHLLYDLVYNPSLTRFLSLGQQAGARIMNGAGMLKIQAEAAWKMWNRQL
ncbi:MAG: shikimate dehydrogenase [Bacteroidales bacterium]|jgi:shikimate dehydrogenase|nr:shikimate dehydrogenase [Bacteroidales bacterium]